MSRRPSHDGGEGPPQVVVEVRDEADQTHYAHHHLLHDLGTAAPMPSPQTHHASNAETPPRSLAHISRLFIPPGSTTEDETPSGHDRDERYATASVLESLREGATELGSSVDTIGRKRNFSIHFLKPQVEEKDEVELGGAAVPQGGRGGGGVGVGGGGEANGGGRGHGGREDPWRRRRRETTSSSWSSLQHHIAQTLGIGHHHDGVSNGDHGQEIPDLPRPIFHSQHGHSSDVPAAPPRLGGSPTSSSFVKKRPSLKSLDTECLGDGPHFHGFGRPKFAMQLSKLFDVGRALPRPPAKSDTESAAVQTYTWIIHPYSYKRQALDTLLGIAIMYSALTIPFRVALGLDDELDIHYHTELFWYNRIVDVLFITDLILNFFTGVVLPDGTVVLDQTVIVQKYLRGWFAIDLLSSIPFEVFYLLYMETQNTTVTLENIARSMPLIRFIKLIRLFRLLRFTSLFSRFEGAFYLSFTTSTIAKFLLSMALAIHLAACIFLYAEKRLCSAADSVINMEENAGASHTDLYVMALYWAVATFLTVGYGDITAKCTGTKCFSICVMLIGTSFWTYGLTFMMMLVNDNLMREHLMQGDQMDHVNKLLTFRPLPSKIKSEIRDYFGRVNAAMRSRELLANERKVLNQMTPWLREEVISTINLKIIKNVGIFEKISRTVNGQELINRVMYIMCARIYRPDEFVAEEGQFTDRLYILAKGRVEQLKWGKIRVAVLEDGACFGEQSFLPEDDLERRRWSSIFTRVYCDIRYISRSKFLEALHTTPGISIHEVESLMKTRYTEVLKELEELERLCASEYPHLRNEYLKKACLDNLYHDSGHAIPSSYSTHISPTSTLGNSPSHRMCVTRPSSVRASPTNQNSHQILRPASVPTSPQREHVTWTGLFNLDPELPLQGVYEAGPYFSPVHSMENKRIANIASGHKADLSSAARSRSKVIRSGSYKSKSSVL